MTIEAVPKHCHPAPDFTRPLASRYQVHQAIARGGMATVYLGSMQYRGAWRPIALKRLRPDKAPIAGALVNEARVTRTVRHPHVVKVLDLLFAEQEWFLSMPFVQGATLSKLIAKAGSPPVSVSVAILVDTLRGLHAAHTASDAAGRCLQIVHRDVTPQNILIGQSGSTQLIDFGVASWRTNPARPSEYLQGKPGYFAPEQVLGHEVDARSDVFAAGVVLWEALAGRRLFTGETALGQISSSVLQGITVPSRFNRCVCSRLDGLVQKALCRQPEQRHRSAADFADALVTHVAVASRREVARYVRTVMAEELAEQRQLLRRARKGQLPSHTLVPRFIGADNQ